MSQINQPINSKPKEETINIVGEIVQKYLPYWPIFVITIAIGLTGSFFKLRYATPQYEAGAGIMLKDKQDGVESVLNALEGTEKKKNVENEIELLKSKNLMTQVVKNLGIYAHIYQPGRVKHLITYNTTPVTFVASQPDSFRSTPGLVPFTYLPKEKAVLLEGKKYPLEMAVQTPYGKFKIQHHSEFEVSDNKQYFLQLVSVNDMAKGLVGHLNVFTGGKQSTIVNLKISDPSPQRAIDVLSTLIKVYNEASIRDKNSTAAATLDFIDNRLKLVINELSNIEMDVQNYKSREGVFDISTEGTAVMQQSQAVDSRLAEISIQISVLDEIERYVYNGGAAPATLGITDPQLLGLLNKLSTAEMQLDRLKKTAAENSPSILTAKSEIDKLKPNVLENIRNSRKNLQITRSSIQGESYKFNSILKSIPKKEREIIEIGREQGVKQSIYTFLLQKREETALSYASSVADTRLVNPAESNFFPIYPVKFNFYFVGLALGVVAAIGFVLLRETYISNVVFRSEIEKATNAKIIAEILNENSKDIIVVKDGKNNAIAEQFRTLRTSLSYLGINKDNKIVLLTSSISGEGKSFISINLANSFALTGKKVILLELDLRKPKLSVMLNLNNNPGMTDYLAGLVDKKDVIKEVKSQNNFYIVTAGNIPPNPTELIINGKLDVLIEELKAEYDYIILDSPPIGLVSDARLLNKFSDLSLYIVRHKHTPKSYLKFIDQVYSNGELRNMNIVFNGLKPRGVFGSVGGKGYGAGYGYGSGYGYGYVDNEGPQGVMNHFKGKLKKKPKK
ncbi:MAG: polysaccharide biosynthesis tyrosine autokinase [Bacteroidia bacterium]|nr:polysaccharide biosynthesis tyrosine autokinase [Bacteroidia bacterium]